MAEKEVKLSTATPRNIVTKAELFASIPEAFGQRRQTSQNSTQQSGNQSSGNNTGTGTNDTKKP